MNLKTAVIETANQKKTSEKSVVSIRIPVKTKEKLNTFCTDNGIKLSNALKVFVEELIKEES